MSKHVAKYCIDNPKTTSSKNYDSVREKAPKSLNDQVYCAVFWYVLQDLCARLQNMDAAWLSNAGDLSSVRLSPLFCMECLLQILPTSKDIFINRIEYSSLLDYLV